MTGEPGGHAGEGWPTDDEDLTRTQPIVRPQHPAAPHAARPPMRPVPPAPAHAMPVRIEPARRPPQRQPPPPQYRQPPQRPAPQQQPPPPPQPAPAQQEPTPEPPEQEQPQHAAPVRRRRRGLRRFVLVTTALLLIVGIAAAVALTRPDVANRLALPWAPNAPTGPEPSPAAVQRSISGADDASTSATGEGVSAALRKVASSAALGSLSGSVLDPATGDVLWERNADRSLSAASTTKVLTAAAALLELDHTSRLTTKVVEGDEPGSVVLVAGGDPTLSSLPAGKESVYPGAAHLDDLVEAVREATGGDVEEVQLDLGVFRGDQRAPGWEPEDAPSTYAAPVDAAMLDGGRSNPARDESLRTGDPAGDLADEFAERLGAKVTGTDAQADPDAKVLGEVRSAPMTELVDNFMNISDNVLAEAVARQVAIAAGEEPSFGGGAKATVEALREAGFDVNGVQLEDASGLSAESKVPARLLAEILAAAAGDGATAERLRPLLGGLPVAGGSGTLASRYQDARGKPGRGWVRAKTGTLTEVNTLAGVVLDKDGEVLVFSFMAMGTGANEARPALDAVAAALRGCGCG